MRSIILIGEYDLVVDVHRRVTLPAAVRRLIVPEQDGAALILLPGVNLKLWFYPETVFQRLAGAYGGSEDSSDVSNLQHAFACRVELDSKGRLLLPANAVERLGLRPEVTLIGAGDHLELWNRDDWSHECGRLLSRWSERSGRLVARHSKINDP